jgi:hypothetical protein
VNDNRNCPRCGQQIFFQVGCRHLLWAAEQGGPLEFIRHVLEASPYTEGRGLEASAIPDSWLEERYDWLLERIDARVHIEDGYCFGELVDLDLLCMDVWHAFAPEPVRTGPPGERNGSSLLTGYLKL